MYTANFNNGYSSYAHPDAEWFRETYGFEYCILINERDTLMNMNDVKGDSFECIADALHEKFIKNSYVEVY